MHILVDQLRVLKRLRRQCLVVKLVVKLVKQTALAFLGVPPILVD